MKAKTMLGLIACASACVSLSAFGNETNGWFGVKVENAEIVHPNCATNGAAVTINGSAIKLEDVSLDIDNFASAPTSDGIVKVSATALLTPSSTSDFDVSGSPKAGFAVGIDNQNATNFYGYANGAWHKLAGANPGGGDTSFSMILNYRDKVVSFYVDDVLLTSEDTLTLNADSLASISASGSGSITSVTGAYEVAVAAYGDKKYGSIAEAVDVAKAAPGGVAADVQAVDASGAVKAKDAEASNGLNLVVCEAMGLPTDKTTDEATIKLEPATNQSSGNITLAWIKPESAEDGVTIKFQVMNGDSPVGLPCDWDNIQIPMSPSGTYTIVPSIQ